MKTYIIDTPKQLEDFKYYESYAVPGHVKFTYPVSTALELNIQGNLIADSSVQAKVIDAEGHVRVDGNIICSKYIIAGKSIESGGFIIAGGRIEAGGHIEVSSSLTSNGHIWAEKSIRTTGIIRSANYIGAGKSIECAGLSAGEFISAEGTLSFTGNAFAGVNPEGEATKETITCSKLLNGAIKYGSLKEREEVNSNNNVEEEFDWLSHLTAVATSLSRVILSRGTREF